MSYPPETTKDKTSTLPDAAVVNAILDRVRQGEDSAFDELVALFQRPMFNLAYRMLNNYEDANDAAQDIFIKVYNSLDKFRGDSKFSTWLYTLGSNTCRNKIRKRNRINQREVVSLDDTFEDSDNSKLTFVDPAADAIELIKNKEVKELVEKAISELGDDYQRVIIMRDLEHLTYEEVAQATGSSMGTVKSRLSRARALVKEKLAIRLYR